MSKKYLVNGISCDNIFEMQFFDDFLRLHQIVENDGESEASLDTVIENAMPDYSNVNGLHYNQKSGHCSIEIDCYDDARQLAKIDISTQISIGEKVKQFVVGNDPNQFADGPKSTQVAIGRDVIQTANGTIPQQISIGDDSKQSTMEKQSKQFAKGDSTKQSSLENYSSQLNFGNNSIQLSAGNYCSHETIGSNNIVFAAGHASIVKGFKGTWITLCERDSLTKGLPIVYVASAQIGNPDYLDCYGNILNHNTFYVLNNKQFVPVIKINNSIYKKIEKMYCEQYEIDIVKIMHSKTDNVYFVIETPNKIFINDSLEKLMNQFKKEREIKK